MVTLNERIYNNMEMKKEKKSLPNPKDLKKKKTICYEITHNEQGQQKDQQKCHIRGLIVR